MNPMQTRLTLGLMGLAILLWVLSPLAGSRIQPPGPLPGFSPEFDQNRAFEWTREFVTRNPKRLLGSLESRQSSGFIQKRLQALGYEVGYAHFDARIGGAPQAGRNIFALKPGSTNEILALAAHYDTAATTVQGATDNGSGVGVLLELARVLSARPNRRGILILASDGEEWGMLGAREFVETYGKRDRIVAALSIDGVAPGETARLRFEWVGQFEGYAPPWMRGLARAAAQAEASAVEERYGLDEVVDRALLVSWTDQGPFLEAGIPAFNIGGASRNAALEAGIYHSARDTIDNLRPESLGAVGRAAERIVLALDALPAIPAGGMDSLAVTQGRGLPGWLAAALCWFSFAPLAAAFCYHAGNHGRFVERGRVRREISNLIGLLIPLLLIHWSIRVLALARMLPRYTLYPAPPGDPVLLNPPWGLLAAAGGVVLAVGTVLLLALRYFNQDLPRPDFFGSKTVLLAVMLLLATGALVYNPYWAVTFLLLPAWVWSLLAPGKGAGGRAANVILVISAGAVYFGLTWAFAGRLGLGWEILWYQALALETGLFTTAAFTMWALAIALGLRFCAIQWQSPLPGANARG